MGDLSDDAKRRAAYRRPCALPELTGHPGSGGAAHGWPVRVAGHVFWPDDISLLDAEKLDPTRLLTSGQVTDSYLLALACSRGGQLATFDRRPVTNAVFRGEHSLHLIT